MALNTRRAARRREKNVRDIESNTEDVTCWSRLISELVVLYTRDRNPSYISSFFNRGNRSSGDIIEPKTDSIIKENKIENYIKLV
jgi:hypothetical protein